MSQNVWSVSDKKILIIGSSHGIGKEIAQTFLNKGA